MSEIFYPFNSDNKEIFIASSSKGLDIKASEITEERLHHRSYALEAISL